MRALFITQPVWKCSKIHLLEIILRLRIKNRQRVINVFRKNSRPKAMKIAADVKGYDSYSVFDALIA